MKKGRTRKRVGILFITLLLLFIWGNSILPPSISNMLSDGVTSTVGGEITHNGKQEETATTWLTSGHIRKMAHVTEFAVLGIITFLMIQKKQVREKIPLVLLFGLLVALVDETIQLFDGRTSAVKDVWIDFGGYVVGCVLAYGIWHAVRKR